MKDHRPTNRVLGAVGCVLRGAVRRGYSVGYQDYAGFMTASTSTLDLINNLCNERQSLWRLAGKQRLTDDQRDRIGDISSRLNALWHDRRCEMTTGSNALIRSQKGRVADYTDTLKRKTRPKTHWWDRTEAWEETGRSHSKTEHEAMMGIQGEVGAKPPMSEGLGDALVQFGAEVLREVLQELHQPKPEPKPEPYETILIDTAV